MGKVGKVVTPFPYVTSQPVTNRSGSIGPSDFHLFELLRGVLQRTMLQRTVFFIKKSGCYNERGRILSADVARA